MKTACLMNRLSFRWLRWKPESIFLLIWKVLCLIATTIGVFFFTPLPTLAKDNLTIHIKGPTQPPGFLPEWVTVHVNDSIVFLNDALPPETYTLVAPDNSFASPPITSGHQWVVTFSQPGMHEYHDLAFAKYMVGEIVVVPASSTLFPTPAPASEATVIAQIKAEAYSKRTITMKQPQLPWIPLVGFVIAGFCLLFLAVLVYHRRNFRNKKV